MSRDLGISPGTSVPLNATRVARPGWRDPRLWIGIALVTGSVVAGGRLFAAADDTVQVWALTQDRGSGSPVVEDDLTVQRVRFIDGAALGRYFPASEPVPADLVLTRAVGAGELLARTSVGAADQKEVLRVPLEVDPNRVPPDVETGSVVDVWVTDGAGLAKGATGQTATLGPALSEVTVVAAPEYDDTFAVTGARQLVVAVEDPAAADFERLLGSLQEPVIRILQRS
ncbi:MAG: hypothetical protein NTX33_13595 [Propionibacteriales bacterium]|nr:hypothetical protein [Propionibacteriales bacterium]